jgi:uncharacterized protein (TIGR00730 family)
MNICVFCSASEVAEKYVRPAEAFARLIGEKKHTLLWGGSDRGLMKVVASGVQDAGGKIIGVSAELLKENARKNADEMIIAPTIAERKKTLIERADAIVILVGGFGSLDELSEALELKSHGAFHKPIVILDTDDFYAGLKQQLEKMDTEGFLKSAKRLVPLEDIVYFADTPEDAMRYIEAYGA